jgi:hypothetical protein
MALLLDILTNWSLSCSICCLNSLSVSLIF